MYREFRTVRQAKAAYRRCRTMKDFILNDDSPDLQRLTCPVCNRRLDDDPCDEPGNRGNRCEYHADSKKVVGMHYICSWQAVFGQILDLVDYLC